MTRTVRELLCAWGLHRRGVRATRAVRLVSNPNEPLLRQVLIHIELFPEQWDQGDYICGSTACFAGWVVALSEDVELRVIDRLDGDTISHLAAELLGMRWTEAMQIFGFTSVWDPALRGRRRPTFAELCARVETVTGVEYKITPALTAADYAHA